MRFLLWESRYSVRIRRVVAVFLEAVMRSFFPGMDPYLEDPGGWTGVHDGLVTRLRTELNHRLGPGFVADACTSVYVVSADEQRWVFPDIFVIETRRAEQAQQGARVVAPVQVLLNVPETVNQPHILIRDRETRRVMTVIEVLSPINKAPPTTRAAGLPGRATRRDGLRDELGRD
jgi:hypothetical protein